MKIDLHTHSTYSDGTLEPEDLVSAAHKLGITHMALSDHDSVGGLAAAQKRAKELDMTIIPAVEINTKETSSVHILGYFFDPSADALLKRLQYHREVRVTRSKMIIERLQKMGIKISVDDFSHKADGAAIGRPHIADKLKEKGVVFSRQEAFEKYLSQGKSAYVFYEGPSPQDAIEAILGAKGIPSLAHPGYYVSRETIEGLVKLGLQGIEVYYPCTAKSRWRSISRWQKN